MKSGAIWVAAGIFLSRIFGLIRERVFAHYFGNSDAGDAFKAALKIPNFLQNLFGEGVLSASFIPVYAHLLAEGQNDLEKQKEAQKLAQVILTFLMLAVSLLVLLGVWFTPQMINLIAPGFSGEKKDLTIRLVQIFFPGIGFLVLSAWCLGVLNSHRKFFLSYAAPVIWNLTIIIFLIYFGSQNLSSFSLAQWTAWGLVGGSFLQFMIQLPVAWRLLGRLRLQWQMNSYVKTVLKNFTPVVVARGVVQVSAYIDSMLASFLPTGAVSSLAYAQTLYLLPVSLFGMSVSAVELTTMSTAVGSVSQINEYLRNRLWAGLRTIAFFIIPSVVGFLFLGDRIVSAVFQTGQFNSQSSQEVWFVLMGSTIGLLATTQGRLFASTFYSLKDTKTPLKIALVRVALTTILGYVAALYLPEKMQEWFSLSSMTFLNFKLSEIPWGTVGLTASAGVAGWIEFVLLKRRLLAQIGPIQSSFRYQATLWGCALLAALLARVIDSQSHLLLQQAPLPLISQVLVTVGAFGIAYLLLTLLMKIPESQKWLAGIRRRL